MLILGTELITEASLNTGGQLAQVSLADVGFAAAADAAHVAARSVDGDPGVDVAAVGLAARDRAGVFLEAGPLSESAAW